MYCNGELCTLYICKGIIALIMLYNAGFLIPIHTVVVDKQTDRQNKYSIYCNPQACVRMINYTVYNTKHIQVNHQNNDFKSIINILLACKL